MKYILYVLFIFCCTQKSFGQRLVAFDSTFNCFTEVKSIALGSLSLSIQIDTVECTNSINVKGRTITPFFNLKDSSVLPERSVMIFEADMKIMDNQLCFYIKKQIATTDQDGYFNLQLMKCDSCALIFRKEGFMCEVYELPHCE